jgi:hypothetical protein
VPSRESSRPRVDASVLPPKPVTMLISKSDRKKVYKYLFEGAPPPAAFLQAAPHCTVLMDR